MMGKWQINGSGGVTEGWIVNAGAEWGMSGGTNGK